MQRILLKKTKEYGLVLKRTRKKGIGVFTTRSFDKGERILDFAGDFFTKDQLPESEGAENKPSHFMQIGRNIYQGPSDDMETFTNHSCDPNCGVIINGINAYLVAIRDIVAGEEITWDYSTTMSDDNWQMECFCNSDGCRKEIREFKYLPKEIQKKYIRLCIVPDYVIDSALRHHSSQRL